MADLTPAFAAKQGSAMTAVALLLLAKAGTRRPLPLREQWPSSSVTMWLLRTRLDSAAATGRRCCSSVAVQQ